MMSSRMQFNCTARKARSKLCAGGEIALAFGAMEEEYRQETGTDERLLQHMATYTFNRINGRIDIV